LVRGGESLILPTLDSYICPFVVVVAIIANEFTPNLHNIYGRLFGRKGTVASMLPWIEGNPRPHSGMHRRQAHGAWSASRQQRDLCVGRRPARGRRVGENQKGQPVSGEDET
jgi:hypothetical protein